MTEFYVNYSFTVKLDISFDPCTRTFFDQLVLGEMTTKALGTADVQTFDDVFDTESLKRGDRSGLTFCGPRVYSVVDQPSYIQLDNTLRQITLETTDQSLVGQSEIEILIMLQDYPDVTKKATLKLTINPCEITEYTGIVDPTSFSYTVNDPAITSFVYTFT